MDIPTIARQIARDSLKDDTLDPFDRSIAGPPVVQLRLPLRDTKALKRHLLLVNATVNDCLALIDQSGLKDRSIFMDVRTRIRLLNQKINAYRTIRPL